MKEIENIKQNSPVFYDLLKLLVKAHNEKDQQEKQIILAAMDYYTENKGEYK